MNASLDTNVIIHLYKAGFQDVLFNRFNELIVYEFIRTQELKRHSDPDVLQQFDNDVETGKIEIITEQYLKDIGMYAIFKSHVNELRILFDGGDLGEVYAISIAKTLGCISLVTDDIKERGPHYTLIRFNKICDVSDLTMNCTSKLKSFMRRFWHSPYSDSEKEWMEYFCEDNGIKARERLQKLYVFLAE